MTPPSAPRALEFLRDEPLRTTRVVPDPLPAPAAGSVLLRIERFVVTSTNISYALNGDALGHWGSFPATEPGWGRVPAWGLARVVDGALGPARPGRLLAGYLPMATHVLVAAEPLSGGLRATAPGRAGMHTLYRDLEVVDEPFDDIGVAVRPTVLAAAHLDEELRTHGVDLVVFSSATSRTALTTAVLLRRSGIRVVGLTGPTRTEVAARAEVFDDVLSYDQVSALPRIPGTVYVDVAGRPEITAAVHQHLGPALARSVRVGGSHAAAASATSVSDVPTGPPVERFNVGLRRVELAQRIGEDRVAELEHSARGPLTEWGARHLAVERVVGLEPVRQVWERAWRGELDPLTAVVVEPGERRLGV